MGRIPQAAPGHEVFPSVPRAPSVAGAAILLFLLSVAGAAHAPADGARRRPAPESRQPGEGSRETGGESRRTERGSRQAEEAGGTQSTQRLVVPAGRSFTVTLRDTLSTRRSRVGDRFTAELRRPLRVEGEVVVPAGATVEGEITAVRKSGSAGEQAVLRMGIRSLQVEDRRIPMRASITGYSAEKRSRTGRTALVLVVAAAALAGGVAGRYLDGGGSGVLVGAALAAAAAAVAVMLLHDVDVVLPGGSELTLRLDQALEVVRPPSGY